MIRLQNISKKIGDFSLQDITLEIAEGSYTVILGDSGSGKTLLLELLAGLHRADSGRILVDDFEVQGSLIQDRPFGIVFQDLALFPHMSVRKNISYPLLMKKVLRSSVDDEVAKLARKFEISHLLERFPGTLSGGEKQRVALARTLATHPACLLLDEPLTALDSRIRKEIKSVLRWLHREGQTIIHVTHDYQEAVELASHIGIMEKGKLIQHGTAEEVLHHPVNTFTAHFTGIRNFIKVTLDKDPVTGNTRSMTGNGIPIAIETHKSDGWGYVIIPEEAIFLSTHPVDTSAANTFRGIIRDMAAVPHGIEVTIDAGFPLYALLTREGIDRLNLAIGNTVWASFKATAVRFVKK